MTSYGPLLDQIKQWLGYRAWASNVPGLQAAIWLDGRVQATIAIGYDDTQAQTPLTTSHQFRIASHSKMMTAIAVLQLRETGALDLDDKITRWIPELAEQDGTAGVTVRHLLTHRGGILRDGLDADYWQFMKAFPDAQEFLGMARRAFGVTDIESEYKYSNIGYGLLGIIVERASGQSYIDYMRENLVERLGLTRTGADVQPGYDGPLALGHGSDNLSRRRSRVAQDVQTKALASATGFYSTAEELVTIAASLFSNDSKVLNEESRQLLITSQLPVSDPCSDVVSYGYGVRTLIVDEKPMYGHGGNYPGHTSQTLWDPETGVAVSVLVNAIEGAAIGICKGVIALMRRGIRNLPGDDTTTSELQRFAGRYASIWDVVDMAVLDGRLTMIWPANADPLDGALPLAQAGPTTFKFPRVNGSFGTGESVEFAFDDHDTVESVRVAGTTFKPVDKVTTGSSADTLLVASH
ncbi:serine hydrolase domain-containing protein [Dactylosporangium fulvum]|uniref:Beta-lactamase family protein n=1 Tax=Dactylosporangium fulvum TaxID=53359 RepID=A0ABY5WDL8_9ACTN|nr:serine hydrolase domain-containing protein [Dactylosporangium fulvum]UWP86441.1 beta-lactamase family protein [Dactylosporangium fulvum]